MALFRKPTDEEELELIEKRTKEWIEKYYDLLEHQMDYPAKSYLLRPSNLYANGYTVLNDGSIKISICYSSHFSLFITDSQRIGYDRIIKGSLLCGLVKEINELSYSKVSNIKTAFFSKYKEITFPVSTLKSVKIKCSKIYIGSIDTFVSSNNGLVPESEFLENMTMQFKRD